MPMEAEQTGAEPTSRSKRSCWARSWRDLTVCVWRAALSAADCAALGLCTSSSRPADGYDVPGTDDTCGSWVAW